MADTHLNSRMVDSEPEIDLLNSLVGKGRIIPGEKESASLRYLKALASSSIGNLNHEPERLKEEKEQLLEQTQNLAFQNYQTFIQAAECSKEIYKDFNVIEDHLHALLDNVPVFGSHLENFQQHSQEINVIRKQNSLVLSRHTKLLEILEIPQLMDTCVRNGYYEEALELSNYVKRIGKKLSSIHIVSSISKEVKNATRVMLKQLLQQLSTNIQLPACLRMIGYLRQLEVFTEAELRIKFLQARDSWFQSILNAIPTNDSYHHITKVVEVSRVHLFDIITQYRAIFSDDDPIIVHREDESVNYSHLLQAWIARKVSSFIQILELDLNKGLSGRFDSVLGQCMYFGLSFSRVGADFRSLLIPVFHRAVVNVVREKLEVTTKRFEEDLASYSPVQTSRSLHQRLSNLSIRANAKTVENESLSPPQELLDVIPLAHYTNGVLAVFNELRHYPALSIAAEVRKHLVDSLGRVIHTLATWARVEIQSQGAVDREQIEWVCDLAAKDLLPYFNRCLEAVFPLVNVSRIYGLNTFSTAHGVPRNMGLDIETLTGPLSEFLSKKDVENIDETEIQQKPLDSYSIELERDKNSKNVEKTDGIDINYSKDKAEELKSERDTIPDELKQDLSKSPNNIINASDNTYDETSVS